MTNQPFFTKDRDAYIPTPIASGPWDPKSLHGRVIIGLLAFAIEERHGADDFVPARLTVDMFRLPDLSPIEVKTKLIRDGLRIKVVEADFFSGRRHGARVVPIVAKDAEPAGPGLVAAELGGAAPADMAVPEDPRLGMYGKWTTRPIVGAMGTLGPRRVWKSGGGGPVEGGRLHPVCPGRGG